MTALWFPVTQRGPALLSPLRLLLEYARPEDSLCPSVGLWNRLSQRPICCLPPTLCHLSHQPTVGGEGGEAASGSARKCHHVNVRAGMVTFWAHYSSRPDSRLLSPSQGRNLFPTLRYLLLLTRRYHRLLPLLLLYPGGLAGRSSVERKQEGGQWSRAG